MPMYEVSYQSMTACYGPSYIQADDEDEACRKFGGSAFSQKERGLINATLVSDEEISRALRQQK